MLAQRCKQSQSTRKRNGEAFPEGNTANYLIVRINCSFSRGWCGKYSTSAANKPVHNAEAGPSASHCFPHKHVLLFRQTSLIRFHLLLSNYVCTFTAFEALAISSIPLWRNKKFKTKSFANGQKINVCQINDNFVISLWKTSHRSIRRQKCKWKPTFFWSHFIKGLSEPRGNV